MEKQKAPKAKTLQACTIPSVGLGTYQLRGEECRNLVHKALDLGYRHIDTAQVYENEAAVGDGIAQSPVEREELFITTKMWFDKLDPDTLKLTFKDSLKNLKTEYIDLLLIHWPAPQGMDLTETLPAMEDLKELGEVRYIGVSNFTLSLLDQALSQTSIIANQVEYHPYLHQHEMLNKAIENDLFLIAYSPLAKAEVTDDPRLTEIGEKHGKTASQVAIRWLIQQCNVLTIPRSSSIDRIEENFDVFDFDLTKEEMRAISELARGHRLTDPDFAPDWEK